LLVPVPVLLPFLLPLPLFPFTLGHGCCRPICHLGAGLCEGESKGGEWASSQYIRTKKTHGRAWVKHPHPVHLLWGCRSPSPSLSLLDFLSVGDWMGSGGGAVAVIVGGLSSSLLGCWALLGPLSPLLGWPLLLGHRGAVVLVLVPPLLLLVPLPPLLLLSVPLPLQLAHCHRCCCCCPCSCRCHCHCHCHCRCRCHCCCCCRCHCRCCCCCHCHCHCHWPIAVIVRAAAVVHAAAVAVAATAAVGS
jgi:hypothetical protein